MPHPFPHQYSLTVSWRGGRSGRVQAGPRPEISGGPPPEFDGNEKDWSPEHLLLAAVNLCLMISFLSLARKSRLDVKKYEGRIDGTLDKTEEGLVFTSIGVHADLGVGRGASAEGQKLMEKAKKYCIVSNALRVPVNVESRVTESD
ncbi:MAG: OsmC family protein [Pseudomonadota bacterium]